VSRHRVLILVVVAAALVRAAWSVSVSPAAFLEIDGADYRDIAQNLSAGRGYAVSAPRWFEPAALLPPGPHPDFARPPLLPVLGAALFRLPGGWEAWARALMVAVGTLAVWLTFRAGAAAFDRRTGVAAAAALALHPYAIYYSGRWSTETPFLTAVLGAVVILAEWGAGGDRRPRADAGRTALAGLLTGLAALARPTGLALIPAFGAWIVFHPPRASRRCLTRAAVFLGAAVLTLTPWTLRNHSATGRWNPGTFFGPYNLWAGMQDGTLSMYKSAATPRFAREVQAIFREDSRAMVRAMEARGIVGPVAEARFWSEAARSWMRAHPQRVAEILARRAAHYFRTTPETSVLSPSARVAALYLWPVHLLALLALWWNRRRVPWLLLLPPLAGLLASLPFVFSLRFRFPFLDPYAVLFAAAAVSEIPNRLWWRRR
jgi:4-amino-4-deoxy-L-arabinose transferase-like glycosyltransferase